MIDFEYYRPLHLEEALSLCNEYGEEARLLAGGTELINEIRSGKTRPRQVIDLKHIKELDGYAFSSEGLKLGALVKVREVETSGEIRNYFPALSHAAGTIGSVQIRNKATIAGNICRASPSADSIPPLIALGSTLTVHSLQGDKKVFLEDFLVGPGKTILKPGEILTEIFIPYQPSFSASTYIKLSPRQAMDLAVVGVAVNIRSDTTLERCTDVKIVLGAVAPTAIRARRAEAVLSGSKISDDIFGEAAHVASEEARPVSDIRASEWYRRRMVEVLVKRALNECWMKIVSGRHN